MAQNAEKGKVAHVAAAVPDYLRSRRQWLVWRFETVKGRLTKPPYSALTLRKCDATDSTSWASYEHAKDVAARHNFDGVGFALSPDDDLTGIDLDHCRDSQTGEIVEWVRKIIAFGETYCEISPSGTGIRMFARGKVKAATKCDAAGVEIYSSSRYLTVTGNRVAGAPDEIKAAPLSLHLLHRRIESFRSNGKDASAAVVAKVPASGDNFFRRVNDLAMKNLSAWVPVAFPTAVLQRGTGVYRVSSEDLGRELQEDLSIAPDGIVDFGLHDMGDPREGKRTPIDVIMHYPEGLIEGRAEGEISAIDAALWLCKTLGADPVAMGWREREEIDIKAVFDASPIDWDEIARHMEERAAAETARIDETLGAAPTSRDELRLASWLLRELPPRDFLSGDVLSTTSRLLLIGPTGIGKTLFSLAWAAAIAGGADFLGWQGRRPARVMYLDGEMSADIFKERLGIVANLYGEGIELFAYNRDVLAPNDMPPLNSEIGRVWLWREIDAVRPDVIFFDNIMSLSAGSMSDEEAWGQVKDLTLQISARRVAQVWLHHTGHDSSKGFGTKTREWQMESVIMLSKIEGVEDEGNAAQFALEFTKARTRSPANYRQFASRIVRSDEEAGFVADGVPPAGGAKGDRFARLSRAFDDAYEALSVGVARTPGHDGWPVEKVSVAAIRDELKRKGYLESNDKGHVVGSCRERFRRVKESFIASNKYVQDGDIIWKVGGSTSQHHHVTTPPRHVTASRHTH